ncbi:dixin-like isoform X3 [Stegostoma tigrinum]|uniref:dixin-like isoform X3 n=1 Tax=Stegostoma tigrinum TaxID=3053191 RepID=UPI00202AE290|nr:dixin-like isoform X3 [Stegostoma tigrinum]XP_048418330.1 dixin-like isoform X3 [Stegostoma tigrinum]XP_048418331.1 dixin-like isoform X3 [Stegostoma tigrinum]
MYTLEKFSQQLQSYVVWVNSQLKKKPGLKLVQDLRQDLCDGVVLTHLVEIVAGEQLGDICFNPTSHQEMKENVEKVLQFITSKKIRMHQTSARDIVEGNLKCIMRLILALAAHFKPSGVRSAVPMKNKSTNSLDNHRPLSATAMVQTAAAALAEVRQDVSRSGREVFRYKHEVQSFEDEVGSHTWSVRAMVQQYEGQQIPLSPPLSPSVRSESPTNSAKPESFTSQLDETLELSSQKEEWDSRPAEDSVQSAWMSMNSGKSQVNDKHCLWEDQLLDQQDQLGKEMEEARKMISILQGLLLNGSLPEDEQEGSFPLCEQGASAEEQLVIIKSRLDLSMDECKEMKRELLKYKQETRNLQGVKDALQHRMAQQESSILQLKQELLRASMAKDELLSENLDLQRKTEERNRLLGEFKRELGQKDRLFQQQQAKLDDTLRKLTEATHLKNDLQKDLERKDLLLQQLLNRDEEEVSGYPSKPLASNGYIQSLSKTTSPVYRGTEDLQVVRDSLRSLRSSFAGHDPQHHTIDTLEQGIASLLERMHVAETQGRVGNKTPVKHLGRREANVERESWPSNSNLHSHNNPGPSSPVCTKVLYFTDRTLVPFMVNIPKRLGEVTLKDFKAAIDREGNYRYHFKALDPEFGTVKEELFHDDDIVPGWEGKIVAWVEESHGDSR